MPTRVGFDEAIRIVHCAIAPVPVERKPLDQGLGLVSAAPVKASVDHPAFDCSAMDGFAIHADDLDARALKVGAPIYAGDLPSELAAGTARPIATGAPVPQGCAAIVQNEIAGTIVDGVLQRQGDALPGRNIRRRGEDVGAGDIVLATDRLITPVLSGMLACYGVTSIDVRRVPRISFLAGGAELGTGPGRIPDANTPALVAMARDAGADAAVRGTLPDDPDGAERMLAEAGRDDSDMIVTSAGISRGPRDIMSAVLERLDADILFRGVRMRPGRPVVFARLPNGKPIICLPGNPLAALVGGRFFMGAAIRAALGLPIERGARIACSERRTGTTLVLKAKMESGEVVILPGQQSHMLRSLADADGWVVVDEAARATLFQLNPRTGAF